MNRIPPRDEQARFKGSLRLHHRGGPVVHRTWDEWITGKPAKPARKTTRKKMVNILIVVISVLVLGCIIAALIIELR